MSELGTPELQVTFDCARPQELARFWAEVLHFEVESGVHDGWASAVDPAGERPRVFFQRVPEAKVVKNRIHLDVRSAGPRSTPMDERRPRVKAEVVRLLGLGASFVETIEDEVDHFTVMRDPEGNEFCV